MRPRKRFAFSYACLAGVLLMSATVTLGVMTQAPAVAAGTATKLVFTTQPTPSTVGVGVSFNVAVSIEDASSVVESSDNTDKVQLSFEYNPYGGILTCAGGTTQTVTSGVASFTCSTTTAFEYQFVATSPTDSLSTVAASSVIVVNPGPATSLAVTTEPMNASTGAQFPVQVSVEDSYGNVETGDSTDQVGLAITPSPAGLACGAGNAAMFSQGVARFTCSVATAGTGDTLTATTSGLPPVVSSSFDVGQESASSIASPDPAVIINNDAAAFTLQVTVDDVDGLPISGHTIAVKGIITEGSDSLATTDASGVATFSLSCPAGYCRSGGSTSLTITDETTDTALGVATENFGALTFPTEGSVTQSETFALANVQPGQPVSVGFAPDASTTPVPVDQTVPCLTDSSGDLASGACDFTVPTVPGVTLPGSVTASVTIGSGAGAQTVQVGYFLEGVPSISLSTPSGQTGTVITVTGSGFGYYAVQTVTFTPAGAAGPTTSVNCDNDGYGNIPVVDSTCELTVPAGSALGTATVAVTGFPSATAPFDVTTTCGEDPSQGRCSLTGIAIDTSALHDSGQDLYVGDSTTLPIIGDYSDDSTGLLPVPMGGPYPVVTFTPATPASSLTDNGLDGTNNGIQLTAVSPSSSAATIQVSYDGFTSSLVSVSAVNPPCGSSCALVNGALLTVRTEVPGFDTSPPLSGVVVDITQPVGQIVSGPCGVGSYVNVGCTPVSTFSGAATLSNATCTTGENGSDTSDPGACQVTDAVGGPDQVTLVPPPDYTITGFDCGGGTESGPFDDPVCTISPSDFSPETMTFQLEPYPDLTIALGGPAQPGSDPTTTWLNQLVNGTVVTVTPTGGTPGAPVSCPVEGGAISTTVGGSTASCTVVVPPGNYLVSAPDPITLNANYYGQGTLAYTTTTNPVPITLNPGDTPTVNFSSNYEPLLTIALGGPAQPGSDPFTTWLNQLVNGTVVTVTPTGGTPGAPVSCPVEGGAISTTVGGSTASCSVFVPPGTYSVSAPDPITLNDNYYGQGTLAYTTTTNPVLITLNPGDMPTVNISSDYENLVNEGSGEGAATTTDGVLSATGSGGTGTVTVGEYDSDPAGAPSFVSGGPYFDVNLSPDSTFTELAITECGLQPEDFIEWWNPQAAGGDGAWQPVSPTSVSWASGGCLTITITGSSSPSISDLTGTVFGIALVPAPSAVITTPASGATYGVGQAVTTSFTCVEGSAGPGIATCLDGHGLAAGGALDTSAPGSFTYSVTATSLDGQATTVSVSYTVGAPQVITFTHLPRHPVFGRHFEVHVRGGASHNPVTVLIDPSAALVCALDPHGTRVTFIGTGQCVIDASEAGNATYAPATAQLSFTVEAADQYIRFTSIARSNRVGDVYDLSARPGASGLPVVFTIDPVSASVCQISAGSTVDFIAVGSCVIDANEAGNADYNPAPQISQTVLVRPANRSSSSR